MLNCINAWSELFEAGNHFERPVDYFLKVPVEEAVVYPEHPQKPNHTNLAASVL